MNFVGNTASRSIFTSVRNSRGRSRQIAREDKNDFNTRLLVNYSNPFRDHQCCNFQISGYSTSAGSVDLSTMPTNDAIKHISSIVKGVSRLKKDQEAILKQFCTIIFERAEKGDVEAQVVLGLLYSRDNTTLEDSLYWLKKAAKSGDAFAQYAAGVILLSGSSASLFESESLEKKTNHYYIDVDNLDSFFGLTPETGTKKGEKKFDFASWLKSERKKIIKDKKKKAKSTECGSEGPKKTFEAKPEAGIKLLAKGAEQGHLDSQLTLAYYLMNPENALHNEEKGLKYLEKAADQHNSIVALSELGNYYFRLSDEASGEEKTKSAKKSLQYFEKASKLGDNQATYWIGYVYHQGVGIRANVDKALKYLEEAASQGNRDAQYYLALMYRNGEGVDVSATKMLEYLKQATTGPEPHVEALSLLGDMYYYGTSITDVDFVTALDYYKRAGQLGDGDSLCKTGVMYFHGYGTEQSYEKAFYAYQNASLHNNINALRNLAHMYQHGLGVPASDDNARYCRQKAMELETGDDQGSQSGQILAGILGDMQGNLLDVDGEINNKEAPEEVHEEVEEEVSDKKSDDKK